MIADVEAERPDAIWSLGDTVGYGPRPNECCAAVRSRADVSLVGNHDLAALGRLDISEFTHDAAAAATWTGEELEPDSRRYLDGLAPSAGVPGAQLFHASARDPVWEYVLSEEAAVATLQLTTAPLVLVGHSHVALALCQNGERLEGGFAPAGAELDLAAGRWLVNPGSVGQPRDGDARAAWVLLDFDERRAQFRRVPYSVERTQQEIRERGLPGALAERLAHGQ